MELIGLPDINIEIISGRFIYLDGHKSPYIVYTLGSIVNSETDKILKPFKNPNGYLLVDLHFKKKSYTKQVHRLVAEAFIPNPENKPQVNHKDGDKENPSVYNLEWATAKENVLHAWDTGLVKPRYGIDNPSNVYTPDQIHQVCRMMQDGISDTEISKKLGVNMTLMRDIKFRGKWKDVSKLYNIPKTPVGYKDKRDTILKLIHSGKKNRDIILELGLPNTNSNVRHIEYVRQKCYSTSLNDYPSNGSTPVS